MLIFRRGLESKSKIRSKRDMLANSTAVLPGLLLQRVQRGRGRSKNPATI
jgi:hypothetical protein